MDYIAYFKGVSEEEILKYRDNENIEQLELRHSFDVVFNINNKDTDLRIHTLTENINKPYLYEGKFPELNEIILDKTYMELNNLKIGDTINFKYNSFDFELRISGIMDSPEYVYKVKDAFRHSGGFQFSLHAYQRTGDPCERCGTPIQRIVVGQRGTHFCPKCQVVKSWKF